MPIVGKPSRVNTLLRVGAATFCVVLLGVAIFSLMTPGPASRADGPETVRLIAIDAYSPAALWVQVFQDYFIPEVDRRLAETGNYRVDWTTAFSGTLAKTGGVLEALQYGLADIGIVTTPFHPDKVPFYNLSYVTPLVSADIGLVARTVSELAERYPQIKEIWSDYNQVYLTTAGAIDTYQLVTSRPHTSLDAYRGQRIGGVGLNLRYLEGLGAAGVTTNLGDFYNNIATGLVDGVVVWAEAAVSYKLFEVAPYLVDVRLGAVTSKVLTINERTWRQLPGEVQDVLMDTANDYRDELARVTTQVAAESLETYQRMGGSVVTLTGEERGEWAASMPNLAEIWTADLEERGLPGRRILEDYMDIMRANDQPIVRQWDLE